LQEEIFADIHHCEVFCSVIATCVTDGGRIGDGVVCVWLPHLLMMYGKQLSWKSYRVDVSHGTTKDSYAVALLYFWGHHDGELSLLIVVSWLWFLSLFLRLYLAMTQLGQL